MLSSPEEKQSSPGARPDDCRDLGGDQGDDGAVNRMERPEAAGPDPTPYPYSSKERDRKARADWSSASFDTLYDSERDALP